MARMDEDDPFAPRRPKGPVIHEIGQLLDLLSVAEIDERIELLRGEIARLESARDSKEASRKAADAFFKS